MGGFIRSDVKRVETFGVNQKINSDILTAFKDYCKELGYPLNVILELFMQQYVKGRFYISPEDILKWKGIDAKTKTLNSTFNKEIYQNFKLTCKENGFFVKDVLTAFMEKFASRDYTLEYVEVAETAVYK